MVGKAKDIPDFDKEIINDKLKKHRYEDVKYVHYVKDLIFNDCVKDAMQGLEKEFKKDGNRHYPRLLLLGIVLFCFMRGMYKYREIELACRESRFLRILTGGAEPCKNTFRNFLNQSDTEEMRKVFLFTLLRYNELDLLKFLHYFIDSTSAVVRGSKYFKIYKVELEAMKLMKELGLLHNGKPKRMKDTARKLIKMKNDLENEHEIIEFIDLILPKLQIYSHKMYKRIDEFEQAMENSNKEFVCITYPTAPLIKTKKGNWDFAKNLQKAITDNNIIIGSIFINDPDDSKALPQLIPELNKNFEILKDLIVQYGNRRNYTEISKMLDLAMAVCDSGYSTEENITYVVENNIRALIMPKIIATFINNELRKYEDNLEVLSEDKVIEEVFNGKKDMKRIWNGYTCKFNRSVMYAGCKPILEEKAKGLPYKATKARFNYKAVNCKGCPYIKDCKYKSFSENISPYIFESMNKFTQKFYQELYMLRLQKAESIFGYSKGIKGILHLLGTNDKAITNEMFLRDASYNTIHFENIKYTA